MDNKLVPEIARITDFEGNQTVQIFGENFEQDSTIYWWRESRAADKTIDDCGEIGAEVPKLPPEDAEIFKINEFTNQVIYTGETQAVAGGAAIMWVKNSNGFSKPFVVNRPQIINQSLRKMCADSIISVYGKNYGRITHAAIVSEKTGERINLTKAGFPCYCYLKHQYTCDFYVPADVKAGNYKLYVHSGTGGVYGWSEPADLEITDTYTLIEYFNTKWSREISKAIPMPKAEIKTVSPSPLGALVDMHDEIQSAIDSLEKTGGIVSLSAGTYGVTKTINIKPGVVLLGAGEGNTIIRVVEGETLKQDLSDVVYAKPLPGEVGAAQDWQPHYDKYHHAALVRIYTEAGIEGIRIEMGSGAVNGILLANNCDEPIKNAFINRVTVDNGYLAAHQKDMVFGAESMALTSVGSNINTAVWCSTFKAISAVSFLPAENKYLKFIRNHFECTPKQQQESFFCGMQYCLFIENNFVGGRRSMMCQGGFTGNWVYQNRSSDVARSENALEVYMAETGRGWWCGKPVGAGEDYIDVADMEDILKLRIANKKLYFCILDGRGIGQYRLATSVDGNRVYVNKPWDVIPDGTTVLTLVTCSVQNLWVDNGSANSNGNTQPIYGCGIDNVMAGQIIDVAAGIFAYGCYYFPGENGHTQGLPAVAFNTFTKCQMRASGNGIQIFGGTRYNPIYDPEKFFPRTYGIIGNVVHRNIMDGSQGLIYKKNQGCWLDDPLHAGISLGGAYNVITKNHILGYKVSVELLNNCEGNCFDKNTYTGEGVRFVGAGKPIGTDKDRRFS